MTPHHRVILCSGERCPLPCQGCQQPAHHRQGSLRRGGLRPCPVSGAPQPGCGPGSGEGTQPPRVASAAPVQLLGCLATSKVSYLYSRVIIFSWWMMRLRAGRGYWCNREEPLLWLRSLCVISFSNFSHLAAGTNGLA